MPLEPDEADILLHVYITSGLANQSTKANSVRLHSECCR
jgi:hypothetical protein